MVICLERGADLHMAQLMPLPLTVSCFSEIQIGLPFWYRLTRVVLDKGPLNGCVCWYGSLSLPHHPIESQLPISLPNLYTDRSVAWGHALEPNPNFSSYTN